MQKTVIVCDGCEKDILQPKKKAHKKVSYQFYESLLSDPLHFHSGDCAKLFFDREMKGK